MILCLGTTPAIQRSMKFDRLAIDGVNRTADVSQYASGKSINVARVLHSLEMRPLALGFYGGDSGRFLLDDLSAGGIGHDFVSVDPATRMCITLMDRFAGTATELIEESGAIAVDAYQQLFKKFKAQLADAVGVVLSGSLPPEAPPNFYADCVAAANAAGKFVVLDATGEPLRRALSQRPTIVKPNRDELRQTVGGTAGFNSDDDLKQMIRQLLTDGPRWAVVTGGSKETIVSDGTRFWKVSTPLVEVVSAIGSGDSFAAGLAAGVGSGQEVPQACRLAVACGAANAMSSRAGHVVREDVDRLSQRVTIAEF